MKDVLIDNKTIYNFEYKFLGVLSWSTQIIFVLFIIGFIENKPQWFLDFNYVVKIFLGLFLIYRFNSYRKYKVTFTELDRKVCSSIGLYIVVLSFIEYLDKYIYQARSYIVNYTQPFINSFKKNIVPNSN